MKTIVAILALAAVASAAPPSSFKEENKLADKVFLQRQKQILEIYAHIFQPSYYENVVAFAKEFDFEKFKTQFEPMYFDKFMKYYHHGFYPRGEVFSFAHEEQQEEAQALFYMLYTARDFETFYKFACWARQHMNEKMFIYAFTIAVLHREDTRGMYVPAPYEINPQLFVSQEVFTKAYYNYFRGEDIDADRLKYMNIEKIDDSFYFYANYSGWYVNVNEEQKLTYFTEDVGLNAYNFYFHLDYPEWMDGDVFGLNKDRRGELEYYYYQQILARYYLERLSNDMGEIPEFSYRQPIETGYYSSLRYQNGLDFPQRPNGYQFYEKYDEIREVEDYERRIRDIINQGYIIMPDGTFLYLKEKDFFNEFASAVFRNADSPNYYFYKSFLWIARDLLGASFDVAYPNKYDAPSALENYETALRDPMFYQLYKRVMKYFFEYKKAFYTPYTKEELSFPGVNIKDVEVDKLVTFFDYFDFEMYNGMYWNKENWNKHKYFYYARILRLNNKPFTIKIDVESDKTTDAVFRIFLGPKYDSYGREYNIEENRYNFFELDQFFFNLKSGKNVIERHSEDFFRVSEDRLPTYELYQTVSHALEGKGQFLLNNTQAHFGFPSRLLLPKGKKGGMEFQLYVIVSPYHAPEKTYGTDYEENLWSGVGTGARYIDALPFGYPFDRFIDGEFDYPNMYFKDVIIFHKSKYELDRPYYYYTKEH